MTTTLTKSQIFTYAWELARTYAEIEGTGSRAQFGRALKEIHASAKMVAAQEARDAQRQDDRAWDRARREEEWETARRTYQGRQTKAKFSAEARARFLAGY
ncbi:hypothetical protein ACUXK4_004520 [Methylorubrum extorquens]